MTDREAFARARLGAVVRGKWRLDAVLGVGGMAAVYAATHRNGKRVAIKMLHPDLSFDGEIRQRFLREGYLANNVGHPGAVSVLDDDAAEDGCAFLVMELLEGEALDERAERYGGVLPPLEVLHITRDALDVLAAAHDRGIVHRDLKPENLFATTDGRIKILDFGIAGIRELSALSTGRLTGTASMGTPAFMPPEQARGRWEEVDARSDLWALGASAFTLLTGRLVHQADTINEMMLAAMTQPAPRLRTVAPHLPEEIARVVDRALAFEKKDRFRDAREMRQAVLEAYEALAGAPMSAGVVGAVGPTSASGNDTLGKISTSRFEPSVATRRRARLGFVAGAVAAVAALGVVSAITLGRSPSTPQAAEVAREPARLGAKQPAASAPEPPLAVTPVVPVPPAAETEPAKPSASASASPPGATSARTASPPMAPGPPTSPPVSKPTTTGAVASTAAPSPFPKDPLDRRK